MANNHVEYQSCVEWLIVYRASLGIYSSTFHIYMKKHMKKDVKGRVNIFENDMMYLLSAVQTHRKVNPWARHIWFVISDDH